MTFTHTRFKYIHVLQYFFPLSFIFLRPRRKSQEFSVLYTDTEKHQKEMMGKAQKTQTQNLVKIVEGGKEEINLKYTTRKSKIVFMLRFSGVRNCVNWGEIAYELS